MDINLGKKLWALWLATCLFSCSNDIANESNYAISDLLPVHGDTLFCATHSKGVILTEDGGKSWKTVREDLRLNQIMIDDTRRLWGLQYWRGIHEPSYSKIFFSNDNGKNWESFTFDVNKFFPIKIISHPFEPLSVETSDGKQFQLKGNNLTSGWHLQSFTNEHQNLIKAGPYFISKIDHYLIQKEEDKKSDTLVKFDNLFLLFDLLFEGDTLYVGGSTNRGKNAYFFSFDVNHKILNQHFLHGSQILGIRKDSYDRIWIFGDAGIYAIKNDSLEVRYGVNR